VEKWRAWSDCDGEVERRFTNDQLLTTVMLYWVTGTIGTSFAPYVKQSPTFEWIDVPTVVTQFPGEIVQAPRSVAERLFDLREFTHGTAGGHFAAWERPAEFTAGVRAALALR